LKVRKRFPAFVRVNEEFPWLTADEFYDEEVEDWAL